MYVIAIDTGTTIMLSVLKLTDSCVVYAFVHVCNCGCYRCNHTVVTAKVNHFMCCVYIRNVCIWCCRLYNHNATTAKVNQFMCCVDIRKCM